MIAVAPSILFVSLGGVIRGYLSANLQFSHVAISQLLEGVGKLAFGLIFAMLGARASMPLQSLSALTTLGVTLGSLVGYVYLYKCSKSKKTDEITRQTIYRSEKIAVTRRILSISVPITLGAAIMSITGVIDLMMIMRSLGEIGYSQSEASALYGNYTTLAVPMFNLAISIITPVSLAHLPTLAKSHSASDYEAFRMTERSSLDLTSVFAAPMMIGMAVFSKEILSMLFPDLRLEVGANLLLLITPAMLFYSLLNVTNSSLEAVGRVRAPMASMLVGCIFKVAISYVLITRTDLGIYGAPLGTVICYAVALFTSLIIYGRVMGRGLAIIGSSLSPYLTAFAAVICSRAVYERLSFGLESSLALLISIALAAIIYLALITFFGILSPKKIRKMAKYTNLG
jgi:stage V sporulation protein B